MKCKIYTIGGNAMNWRNKIQKCIETLADTQPKFVHPPILYDEFGADGLEAWSLYHISNSDIVIVNTDELNTRDMYDLGIVNALNKFNNKQIFVVGIGNLSVILPPFVESILLHRESNYEDLAYYISRLL